jgi:hypothetical protein
MEAKAGREEVPDEPAQSSGRRKKGMPTVLF